MNAYDFSFHQVNGSALPLSHFKGKTLLIVNTASECGFTKQYEGLQQLYDAYKDRGLVIIAVPSNDFGKQEPGDNTQIQQFCQINYGVNFPVVQKEIVSGDQAHPFYQWAKEQLGFLAAPRWNFHKYLIDKNGNLVDYFLPTTTPMGPKIKKALDNLLGCCATAG